MLHRRDVFRGLALTAAALSAGWAVPVVAAPPAGQGALAWTPKALTPDQARVLTAAVARLVPATDTPGAVEAGTPQFIDRAIGDWCEPAEAARLRAGLDRLDKDAQAKFGGPFAGLSGDQQDVLLKTYDAEAVAQARQKPPHFFGTLKELATWGYFTSEPGATKALRYDPVPGAYRGCVPVSEIGRAWAT